MIIFLELVPQSTGPGYYRRFAYPKQYKNETGVWITKFEKNWNTPGARNITYQLINAFPKSIASIPLQYGEAEIVKVSVTMNYDRYRVYRNSGSGPAAANSAAAYGITDTVAPD